MSKRKKGVTLESSLIDELKIVAKEKQLSFSQVLENAAVEYLERRKQSKPENLKDTITKIVAEEFKKQEGIPSAMRNYWGGIR